MKIVLHDYFEAAEGGGRLSLTLAEELKADLAYGFKVKNHPYFQRGALYTKGISFRAQCKEYSLMPFTSVPVWRQFLLAESFKRNTGFLSGYNTAVYSGFYAPLAVANHSVGKNIYYCHTPPRFLFDQRDFYFSLIPFLQRPILSLFNSYFKPRYERAVKIMDCIVTNSENVRNRIKHYLGLDAVVVYPPCDTERFKWRGQKNYYLSTGRLDKLKRVDLVVDAFRRMADKKLVVVSDGPELEEIRKLAQGAKNITIKGRVNDKELADLVGNCIGTVYIPRDEDFGMSPVESMAAGKPVIGVAEGGLLESVVAGESGFLIPADPGVDDIIHAVGQLTREKAEEMREKCEGRARLFRKEVFVEKMEKIIADLENKEKRGCGNDTK